MRVILAIVLVFASILQTLKCQPGYYPQWNGRQMDPNMNQGGPGGMQGQPVQQPNGGQGNLPNQQQDQQQFPPQGQQQFPPQGQQQFPSPGQQQFPSQGQQPFPQQDQQPFPPQGQQSFPQPGQQPIQQPGGQFPISPPYGMNLTPEGQWAYSYIMQQIAQILNDPTSRNGLMYFVNSLGTILRNPNSFAVMQEFLNRWMNAVNQPVYGGNSGAGSFVQNTQPSSFLDMLKRKGMALANFGKDVAQAKANAISTIFGDTMTAPIARASTGIENMMAPFMNMPNNGAGMAMTQGGLFPTG